MYTPQIDPFATLDLPETHLNLPVISFFRNIVTPYARSLKFNEPEILHPERLLSAWKDFSDKKTRLILGFRHAYGDDPQMMVYTIHHVLPKLGRKNRARLPRLTHAHFIYGSEVPLWSGPFVRWLLPRAGAVPVGHVHMDSKGMTRIRKMISGADFPIALAPEGHVTYASKRVLELETGTARFGFWAMEDLEKQGRTEEVCILPVSTHYRYADSSRKILSRYIAEMEKICGLPCRSRDREPASLAKRLSGLGSAIETRLRSWYGKTAPLPEGAEQKDLRDAALAQAEHILRIESPQGERAMARLYRIRAKAWDGIFREDLDGMDGLQRELARRTCGEAWFAMRHMELAELLEYVPLSGVSPEAPLEDLWETADNFRDYLERIKGGTLRNRAPRAMRTPVIVPGEPIRINDWAELYARDKKAALQAVTDRIKEEYEKCIKEYLHEFG